MAQAFFNFHVGCDFVEDHVARTFNHDLDVVGPSTFGQFAQRNEFFDLGGIGSIMGTARTAGVAETQGDIIFFTDVEETVVVFVERVFLVVHFHPGEEQRAAAGNDVGQARVVFDALSRLAIHAAVDGHEVDAVFCVLFDDGEKFIDGNVFQVLFQHADSIVHGDRADHGRRHLDQFTAKFTGLAEVGQVHDGFGFHIDGILDFLQFFFMVVVFRRNAEVDVNLGGRRLPATDWCGLCWPEWRLCRWRRGP